ncbi:hypothetical protein AAMO2058_000628600 [Amorphochlora amoebiformis]|mmetsp:Transcript_1935/g.2672  ORF Transcript_1935/g.2672 Transcript_1935/m.2672 type:complete len:220 (-) Transcript_1935:354-1013(-)|eukprot:418703-Amorphochlora_amoeboformis.AAC.1
MKECNDGSSPEELVECFRRRFEEETKTLEDLGVPSSFTGGILMHRMCSNEGGFVTSEKEVNDVMVRGRMREAEAVRALILKRELKRIRKTGLDMSGALKVVVERIGQPSPSIMDELDRAQGVEDKSRGTDSKPDYPKKQDNSKAVASKVYLLNCQTPLGPERSTSPKSKLTGIATAAASPPSRKRSLALLRSQSGEFKATTASSLKLNILRRKKQKQKK